MVVINRRSRFLSWVLVFVSFLRVWAGWYTESGPRLSIEPVAGSDLHGKPRAAKKHGGHRSFNQLDRYATQTKKESEEMADDLFP